MSYEQEPQPAGFTDAGQHAAWNGNHNEEPPFAGGAEHLTAALGGVEPADSAKPAPGVAEAILDAGRNRALELAQMFAAQAGQAPGASESNKRKLEDCGSTDAPDLKRPASDGLGLSGAFAEGSFALPSATFLNDSGNVTETVMCPSDKVGRVIGRAGATIRDLEASTSTRIQVDHKAPGEKPVTISGKREDVDRAKRTVIDLISSSSGDPAPVSGEVQRIVECPQGIVGRIIGRGGETIRTLQQASGAHILVNQDFPDGHPRLITITGTHEAVERGFNMVTELISGDHANTQAVIQKHGMGSTEVMECPKAMVGRIIGKGGETIKDLQKRFSASIQIDQNSTPCKVTITGPSHTIAAARRAVEDLVRPTNTPPMGGPRQGGPGPSFNPPYSQPPFPGSAGGPYGGYGGFGVPPPMYPPSGGYPPFGGYPGYPPAVPPYGGYGSYGAPQPDPYASAGAYGQNSYNAGGAQPAPGPSQPAAPASNPWQALQDDQGRTYYYNSQTGVSQWEKPAEMP